MKSNAIGTLGRLSAHALAAVAALAITAAATPAAADDAKRYIFLIDEIKTDSDTSARVVQEIESRLASGIDGHGRLLANVPESAPDPDEQPERFERYMRRHDLRAFQVHMEVTEYRAEVREQPEPSTGHTVTVHIGLRLFGEGIPKATMDFSGDGSATVQVQTGRRVRSRDRGHAHETAIRMAVSESIETSLRELDGPKGE